MTLVGLASSKRRPLIVIKSSIDGISFVQRCNKSVENLANFSLSANSGEFCRSSYRCGSISREVSILSVFRKTLISGI